jgi:transposase
MLGALGPDCILLADRGYDSDALRARIADRGAYANIRPLDHRTNPPAFSPAVYRLRNRIERFFNKLKHFRAIATRFDKHDANYLASIKLAALRIWMRFNESVT